MIQLRLYLLGPLVLMAQDQRLPLPATQKAQSLLAYLAMHRSRPRLRAQLADLYWPEAPAARARRNLNTALWQIRRVLPAGDYLVSSTQDVQLNPAASLWLDVEEFESLLAAAPQATAGDAIAHLRQAVALYRGDLLAGFYDDWVLDERYRLEGRLLSALARLARAYQEQGDPGEALVCAQELLRHDPLREDIHRQVICLHLALGDSLAAARQCNRCRALLEAELGSAPSPETLALCQPLFAGPWPPAVQATEPAGTDEPHAAPSIPMGQQPFVGRERELAQLLAAWQEALAGRGQTVLVSGEAGVGKSRLVAELAQSAGWRDGATLWGRAYEQQQSLPYQPLAEALASGLRFLPLPRPETLAPWVLAELAALLPSLREHRPHLPASTPLGPAHAQARLFTALDAFLAAWAGQAPLLLVLDDLHWAGESTLAAFHYLARHLAERRMLLVGTYRDDQVTIEQPLPRLAAGLRREGVVRELRLPRLSSDAVQDLVASLSSLGERSLPLARRLYRTTGGNPFFLIETLRALAESGVPALAAAEGAELPVPASVRALVLARVARLAPAARDLLHLAAVAGHEFDLGLLELTLGRGEEAVLEALDDLLRAHLLREVPGQRDYGFEHDLTQDVLYQALHPHRRQSLHRRVGQALLALTAGLPRPPAAQIAHHLYQGGGRDPALPAHWGRLAGDDALAHYARREALRWYRQSRGLLDEAGLTPASAPPLPGTYAHLCLGEGQALLLLGEGAAAEAALAEGLRWANATGDRSARADLLYAVGQAAHEAGDFARAREHCRLAAAEREALGDGPGLAEALYQLARTGYDAGDDPTETTDLAQRALALSQAVGDRNREGLARWALGRLHYRRAELTAADACFRQALDCFRQVGNREDEGWTLLLWGLVFGLRYQLDQAEAHFAAAEGIFRDLERPWGIGAGLTQRGMVHLRRGELEQAEALWREALALFHALGSRWEQAAVLWRLGLAAYRRGDLKQAHTSLGQGLTLAEAIGHRELCLLIRLTAGDAHAAAGAWSAAQAAYGEARAIGQATDDRRFLPRLSCGLAQVALANGDTTRAERWLEEGRRLAAAEDVEAQGMLLRLAGEVAAARDERSEALALLQRSVASLAGPPVPFELARSRQALARLEGRPGV